MKKILLGERINKTIFPSKEKENLEKVEYNVFFCAKPDIKLGDDVDKKPPSPNQNQ